MAGKITGIRLGGKLRSGLYFVQYPDGDISKGREEIARIVGGGAIPVHSKVHLDFDPVDEDGEEVGPGDPRLQGFYVDSFSSDEAVADLHQTGDEKDHGCTPVAKGQSEGTFSVRAYAMVDGQKVGDEVNTCAIRLA